MNILKAPYSKSLLVRLNQYQHGNFHPLTCGNDRGNEAHKEYAKTHGGDWGALVATSKGWECPVCHYLQDWSPDVTVMEAEMDIYHPDFPFTGDFHFKWMAFHPLTMEWEPSNNGIEPIQHYYAIYDHPDDFPEWFVVRRWDIYEGIEEAIPADFRLAETLEDARDLAMAVLEGPDQKGKPFVVDAGLHDDPKIIETWTRS